MNSSLLTTATEFVATPIWPLVSASGGHRLGPAMQEAAPPASRTALQRLPTGDRAEVSPPASPAAPPNPSRSLVGSLTRSLRKLSGPSCSANRIPQPASAVESASGTGLPRSGATAFIPAPAADPYAPLAPARHWTTATEECALHASAAPDAAISQRRESGDQPQTRPAVTHPSDRRAHPRRESTCTVSVCRKPDQFRGSTKTRDWLLHSEGVQGRLSDVSMSGVAFQLSAPVEQGAEVWLRISNRRFAHDVDACARILRCTNNGDGWWNVVCRLDKRLTFEQIHQVGQHLFSSTIV